MGSHVCFTSEDGDNSVAEHRMLCSTWGGGQTSVSLCLVIDWPREVDKSQQRHCSDFKQEKGPDDVLVFISVFAARLPGVSESHCQEARW